MTRYKEYLREEVNSDILENLKYYSVSRLKTYKSCPSYYKNKYINNFPDYPYTSSTIYGTIAHSTLETFYFQRFNIVESKPIENILLDSLIYTLKDMGKLEDDMEIIIRNSLSSIASKMEVLYLKASDEYKGKDSIRKKDGSISANPKLTSAWKKELNKLGISEDVEAINVYFNSLSDTNDLLDLWDQISIVDIYNDLYNIFKLYEDPFKNYNIEGIEIPITKLEGNTLLNSILMPPKYGGKDNIYLKGYIDLVLEKDNKLILIDHKTGSQPFSRNDVEFNSQLIVYSWCMEKLTGKEVSHIGINNIGNSCVIVPLPSKEIRNKILNTLFSSHVGINGNYFPKFIPEPYSPCLKMYGKVCPYLSQCWPNRNI